METLIFPHLTFLHLAAFQNMNSKRKAETWKKNRRQLVRLCYFIEYTCEVSPYTIAREHPPKIPHVLAHKLGLHYCVDI